MTIRTGLIGGGAFGANHARKLADLPQSNFQGVFDSDPARAQAIAAQHGGRAFGALGDLLAVCDALVIATPARTHAALTGAALKAGKHVLVEKPLAATAAEAHALARAAREGGLVLQAGHQERFVLQALGLFAAPERPVGAEIVRATSFTGRGMDVSVTLDLMIHDLDLVALLFGAEPARVEARGRRKHGEEWDEVDARLTFDRGAARLFASRIAEGRKRTLRVDYPRGAVEIDMLTHALRNEAGFDLDPDFMRKAGDPLGQAVSAFLDAALSEGEAAISGESGAAAVALAEAVDRALAG